MGKIIEAETQKFMEAQMPKIMAATTRLQRGLMFTGVLPPDADAHYAGKGVSVGAADKPIFWHRPKDAKKYRVIYADLSVRDTDTPPNVPKAQPVLAPSNPKKQSSGGKKNHRPLRGRSGTASGTHVYT